MMAQKMKKLEVENVVIIGSGPAGYTAALYAARANLKPVLFEGITSGPPGGQLMTTNEVENYPGFPEGLTGPELMEKMRAQAVKWGAELYTEDVEQVDFNKKPFKIKSDSRELKANAVIIATGATAKRLSLPLEEVYWSRGISACAICDGAAPMFRGVPLAVVGGGDSGAEEAIYLTKFSSDVHLFVRGPVMKASKTLADRVLNNPKIKVHFNSAIKDVYGNADPSQGDSLESSAVLKGVTYYDMEKHEFVNLDVAGVFYAIGHKPNTDLFSNQPINLDSEGYIITIPGSGGQTACKGVFAAGDVQDREFRQAITAAGTGCQAALSAERYLVHENLVQEIHLEEPVDVNQQKEPEQQPVKNENAENFDITATRHKGSYALRRLYHESEKPVVVKYISSSCGPCKALKPILDKVITDFEGQVHFVEINIEESPEIAENAGVSGTPTTQIFKNKALLHQVRGVKRGEEYRRVLTESLQEA